MINGKSFPKTDTIALKEGKRYRLAMQKKSSDDHPIHLHRHTFEVTSLDNRPLSALRKDAAVVKAKSNTEIDFVAANPEATLFHCHQQSHMDFGFMMLFVMREHSPHKPRGAGLLSIVERWNTLTSAIRRLRS